MPHHSTAPTALRLFGPFEPRFGGRSLPRLRTRKSQWLLALLALRAGSEVRRDWLAAVLWPESPASTALGNLRSTLKDLRRALGGQAERLRSPAPRTLALDLAEAQVDVLDFDAAIARGDTPSLEEAVALYRGPLLEECAEEWVVQERQQREHAYLTALETLAERALASGDTEVGERYLRRVVAADPLRETAQRALMRFLADRGSHAAVLLAYRELRLLLHREVNTEPDPETQALFLQLRAAARRGAGSEQELPQVEARRPRDRSGPRGRDVTGAGRLAGRDSGRNNLPAPPTELIGREQELAELTELLRQHHVRLVTLTGPGGIGKTRLALQAAAALLSDFPEGVYFVDLAPVQSPDGVMATIARTLGLRETDVQPLGEELRDYLRDQRMLLLLDNFEHVLAAAPNLAALLEGPPEIKVLVTSRAALHLRGEKRRALQPLSLPEAPGSATAKTLSQYAAVELFIQRALDVQPGFQVNNANAPAVAEICHHLDGLPLAIELAAARVELLPPALLLARLSKRLPLLVDGPRDLPTRQRTLRSTIGWSYDLLKEEVQILFRRLSVFVGGCTLEAIERVCSIPGEPKIDLLASMTCLIHHSLLRRVDDEREQPRFWMLETIREYARECLERGRPGEDGRSEAAIVRRQYAGYFWGLAEHACDLPAGPELARWWDQFEVENENLRAALEILLADAPMEGGVQMAAALVPFWVTRGYLSEGREQLTRLLAFPEVIEQPLTRARLLGRTGWLALQQGDPEAAWVLFGESLPIWQELGIQAEIAQNLLSLGQVCWFRQECEQARDYFEESLALMESPGGRGPLATTLFNLANFARVAGDLALARSYCERSLAACGDPPSDYRAWPILCLGNIAVAEGDHSAARKAFSQSLRVFEAAGYKWGAAFALDCYAALAGLNGQLERAARLFGAVEALRESLSGAVSPSRCGEAKEWTFAVRDGLPADSLAAHWTKGRHMSMHEAIAYAREGDGEV